MKRSHVALAVAVNAIWGLNFAASKVALAAVPPLFFTGGRFAVVLLALSYFVPVQRRKLPYLIAIAFFGGPLYFGLFFAGIWLSGYISPVAVAMQLVAPFSILLAWLLLHEQPSKLQVCGVAISLVGVVVLAAEPRVVGSLAGLCFTVAAAAAVSTSLVLMRAARTIHPFEAQAWSAMLGVAPFFTASFLLETGQIQGVQDASAVQAIAFLFTALVVTIVAQGGWYWLIRRYRVSEVLPFSPLAPVFGVAFGAMLLGESVGAQFAAGAFIVLLGVILANQAPPLDREDSTKCTRPNSRLRKTQT